MASFILRRILATVVVMAVVALFVFSLLHLAPGDPAAIIAGDLATAADIAQIRDKLGLNEPLVPAVLALGLEPRGRRPRPLDLFGPCRSRA